jgi:hypothetical protein
MIKERLANVDTLENKFSILEKTEVNQDISILRELFSKVTFYPKNDFSDSSREEIIKWFHGLGITENVVKIYWHSTNEGISVDFETFVENFDEFWYPSSDDIWVIGNEKSWLIQVDHEERFSFLEF